MIELIYIVKRQEGRFVKEDLKLRKGKESVKLELQRKEEKEFFGF